MSTSRSLLSPDVESLNNELNELLLSLGTMKNANFFVSDSLPGDPTRSPTSVLMSSSSFKSSTDTIKRQRTRSPPLWRNEDRGKSFRKMESPVAFHHFDPDERQLLGVSRVTSVANALDFIVSA
mmetsp:Transcript_5780/g.8507  ORF Transcript_5780/g.8507 Transcript_5780/m.8507 type:complete len:124 (-) Transcript_5780:327-698(-)